MLVLLISIQVSLNWLPLREICSLHQKGNYFYPSILLFSLSTWSELLSLLLRMTQVTREWMIQCEERWGAVKGRGSSNNSSTDSTFLRILSSCVHGFVPHIVSRGRGREGAGRCWRAGCTRGGALGIGRAMWHWYPPTSMCRCVLEMCLV